MRFLAILVLLAFTTPLNAQQELSPTADLGETGTQVALHPDGDFCAIASGSQITIRDLRDLPRRCLLRDERGQREHLPV